MFMPVAFFSLLLLDFMVPTELISAFLLFLGDFKVELLGELTLGPLFLSFRMLSLNLLSLENTFCFYWTNLRACMILVFCPISAFRA